jgi:hypothetical protein
MVGFLARRPHIVFQFGEYDDKQADLGGISCSNRQEYLVVLQMYRYIFLSTLFGKMLLKTVFGLLAVAAAGFAIDDDNVELLNRARNLMRQSPLIDTHIDLPQIMRSLCQ